MTNVSKWLVFVGLALASGGAQAEIYKWVEEDGVTQFSERRPNTPVPVETIAEDDDVDPESSGVDAPAAEEELIIPPVEEYEVSAVPALCDGDVGATAVGAVVMVLNQAYIRSLPAFVVDNAAVFAADEVYDCIDAIFENAPLHEQIAGCDTCTVSPDAPLAVLLEVSGNLVAALRELSGGVTVEWQKILGHMSARRPKLELETGELTTLIRGVAEDARARAKSARAPGDAT